MSDWTGGEMMAVAAARLVKDTDVAVVGLGLPQVAALLAKRTHAPRAGVMLELGVFDPMPTESAMGIADPRLWKDAQAFGGMLDVRLASWAPCRSTSSARSTRRSSYTTTEPSGASTAPAALTTSPRSPAAWSSLCATTPASSSNASTSSPVRGAA